MTLTATVFLIYFAMVFAIGFYGLKKTKDDSDYWIAGGKLGWLLGGATMAATHASAGTFVGTVGVMYTTGWSFAWLVLTIPLAYWVLAAVLAPRFTRTKELTLPAFIETRYYSKKVRGLAAAIILTVTVVYIQAQIVAGGLIANVVLGIPTEWGMIGFTVVLVAYTVIGGMIAVVYTDLVQLVVMVTGAIIAVPLTIRQLDGFEGLFTYVQAAKPMTFEWGGLPPTLLFTIGIALTLGSISTPEKLIRLYAMRDMPTIRRGVLLALIAATGMNLLIFLLSLASVVLFPVLPTGDLAMPMVARAVLPPLLGAVLLAAITAAMMSTVDSLLIVAGSALSFDIYQNLINPNSSPEKHAFMNRLGVILVGCAPVILLLSGIGEGELVQFIVILFSALMASSFFIPVMAGIFWTRATREGAAASMLGGVSATFLWKAFGNPNVDPVVAGFLCSSILMFFVSIGTKPPPAKALEPYFNANDKNA
ncbi:MAG: sodium:solute symporter family protein [Gemmatimonadota bacterium]|nr:sodium:solute symporter family protein [Gemmatimonadota bacterium]MDH5803567.1 sodium:solute symporter family protein [Gemmatimonadota bacterium]